MRISPDFQPQDVAENVQYLERGILGKIQNRGHAAAHPAAKRNVRIRFMIQTVLHPGWIDLITGGRHRIAIAAEALAGAPFGHINREEANRTMSPADAVFRRDQTLLIVIRPHAVNSMLQKRAVDRDQW